MPMKLILREPVEHLGAPGEIVSVAPGYARNYLLPKGLALEATPGNLKTLQGKRKVWAARELVEVERAQQLADRIAALQLSVTKKSGASRTLFGSVTTTEIAELLAEQGIEIDRRRISAKPPIKTLGLFEIPVKLHRKVVGQVKVEVLPENPSVVAAAAPAAEPADQTGTGAGADQSGDQSGEKSGEKSEETAQETAE